MSSLTMQQFLYFFPLAQGHGWLAFLDLRSNVGAGLGLLVVALQKKRMNRFKTGILRCEQTRAYLRIERAHLGVYRVPRCSRSRRVIIVLAFHCARAWASLPQLILDLIRCR